jgi:hypothetical protein
VISIPREAGSDLVIVESMYTPAKGQALLTSVTASSASSGGILAYLSDWNTLRYLMIVLAFALVGGYQYYKYRARRQAREDITGPKKNSIAHQTQRLSQGKQQSALNELGGAATQQFDQMKKMLEEMEQLKHKTSEIGSAIGGFQKELKPPGRGNGPPAKRNPNQDMFEDSEED